MQLEEVLKNIRPKIDKIDNEILSLLFKRAEFVRQVGEAKKEAGISGCYIRPRRESTMMQELLIKNKEHQLDYPSEAIFTIWRNIISASTFMESPINLAIYKDAGYYSAKDYFGSFLPYKIYNNITGIINEIKSCPHAIGIIPENALQELVNLIKHTDIVIFAKMPVNNDNEQYLAIARVNLTPSNNDISYIYKNGKIIKKQGFFASSDDCLGVIG